MVIFRHFPGSHGTETEQQRGYAVDRHRGLVLVADGRRPPRCELVAWRSLTVVSAVRKLFLVLLGQYRSVRLLHLLLHSPAVVDV